MGTGPPARIMADWQDEQTFELVICPSLIREISDVCSRPHIARRLPRAVVRNYLLAVNDKATGMPDPAQIAAVTRDSGDDYLIALARSANSDFIVSGDKDLLEWPEQQPPVVTPAEFEDLLNVEAV